MQDGLQQAIQQDLRIDGAQWVLLAMRNRMQRRQSVPTATERKRLTQVYDNRTQAYHRCMYMYMFCASGSLSLQLAISPSISGEHTRARGRWSSFVTWKRLATCTPQRTSNDWRHWNRTSHLVEEGRVVHGLRKGGHAAVVRQHGEV